VRAWRGLPVASAGPGSGVRQPGLGGRAT